MPGTQREGWALVLYAAGFTIAMCCAFFLFLFSWGALSAFIASDLKWRKETALGIASFPAYLGLLGVGLSLIGFIFEIRALSRLAAIGAALYILASRSRSVCGKLYTASVNARAFESVGSSRKEASARPPF
jgi:hypothetical protein